MAEFSKKFVAYIDILGFKDLVSLAEGNEGLTLNDLLELTSLLGSSRDKAAFEQYGPCILPSSEKISPDVDFQLTQISDCVIVSTELSDAGAINVLGYCATVVIRLLKLGVMCRGYVTLGSIYHTTTQVIGSGYQKAYAAETKTTVFKRDGEEGGPPFIELDSSVTSFVEQSNNDGLKEIYRRLTLCDEKEMVALYPFKRFSVFLDTATCGEGISTAKRIEIVQEVRTMLNTLKHELEVLVPESNEKAVSKLRHYLQALDSQLANCDNADQIIHYLAMPFPAD